MYAKEKNIRVANVAGYSTDSVVQHTFALGLYLIEKMSYYDGYVKSGEYAKCPIFSKMPFLFSTPRSPICASCICLYLFLISGIILNIIENIMPTEGIKLPNRYIIFSEER